MTRLSRNTFYFALAYAVLIMSPAFLDNAFGPYPLMKNGDVTDILTPLILLPLYWLLFTLGGDEHPSLRDTVLFLVFAAFWAEGQGMHLGANSIGHLLDTGDGDVYRLTHFYDEVLSHYLWHFGMVTLTAPLLWRQWRYPLAGEPSSLGWEIGAGVIYGFTYFVSVTEAATTPLGVPFAVLVAAFALIWGRKHFRQQPVLAFYGIAHALALVLFVVWIILQGGGECGLIPEFSCVGLI